MRPSLAQAVCPLLTLETLDDRYTFQLLRDHPDPLTVSQLPDHLCVPIHIISQIRTTPISTVTPAEMCRLTAPQHAQNKLKTHQALTIARKWHPVQDVSSVRRREIATAIVQKAYLVPLL